MIYLYVVQKLNVYTKLAAQVYSFLILRITINYNYICFVIHNDVDMLLCYFSTHVWARYKMGENDLFFRITYNATGI